MSDLQRSRSLKRPAPSQLTTGPFKRVSVPTPSTNLSHLTPDMATSPNFLSNPFTNTLSSGSIAYGGIAMAQTPSHMSQASYQFSVAGSPPSPLGFPLRQPVIDDSRASLSSLSNDDPNLLEPCDFLDSRGHSRSTLPIDIPVQSQYLDTSFSGLHVPELGGLNFQPSLTTASSSFSQSMGTFDELPGRTRLDAPGMVQMQSQNSFGDGLMGFPSSTPVLYDSLANDCTAVNVSLHMAFPNQFALTGSIPLGRTMTMGSSFEHDHGLNQVKPDGETDQVHTAPAMERNGSSNRNLSQRMRERETAVRHLSNAEKNVIFPKDVPDASHATQAPVMVHRSLSSKSGSSGSGKMEIPKARRERPAHERVYCEYCPKGSNGFRGPHELSRHKQRHHDAEKKRYICVDPRPNGVGQMSFTVFKELASCKKCSIQKQYGADYNAAAHLRRTHFKQQTPRTKGRSQPVQDDSSSVPAMDEIKDWILEVTEPRNNSQPSESPASVVDNASQPLGSLGLDVLYDNNDDLDDNDQHYTTDSGFYYEANQSQDQPNPTYQDDLLSQPRGMTVEPIFSFDEDMLSSQFDYIIPQASNDVDGSLI